MEVYKQKEYELRNTIDSMLSLNGDFENYVSEVNRFIDILENEVKEVNILRQENKKLKEQLTREVAVRDDIYNAAHYKLNMLKQRITNYRFNKTGSHEDGRYCVAISVTDLLKWMEELEGEK